MTVWPAPRATLPLEPTTVHLWRAELDHDDEVAQLRTLLTAEERSRAAAHRTEKLRRRAVVSRGFLRCVLARYLAIEPEAVQLRYTAYGKPYLASEPWRPTLRFNLSHSGGIALVAVTGEREVGIDVESLGRNLDYERIIVRFFSPREQWMLRTLPPTPRRHAFFTCWVRKEAYAKATGLGLSLPFAQFTVSVRPGEPAALLAVEEGVNDSSRWKLHDVPVGDGYVAALAAEGQGWTFRQFMWPSRGAHRQPARSLRG